MKTQARFILGTVALTSAVTSSLASAQTAEEVIVTAQKQRNRFKMHHWP